MAKQFQNVRGTYDILPEMQAKYGLVFDTFKTLTDLAGYGRIETPMMEEAGVFIRSIGDGTDVVDKEMYVFKDRGGDDLALRPEGTASVVRAYVQHGMASAPKPVKLSYSGPMFRYDRPQAGRHRQFYQVGVEVLGDNSASIDAQVILLALRFYQQIGLTGITVQVNSLGDEGDRKKYKKALVEYLQANKKKLAKLDQDRLEKNPLRVLDSKEEASQGVVADAPQIISFLCEECRAHLSSVLEYLDEMSVNYELNALMVRGLDYYQRTVFEFIGSREGAQSSLGGGGRYDGLVEQFGGQPTPGVGFALGVERIILELEAAEVSLPEPAKSELYIVSLGEPARLVAFKLIEELQDAGVAAVGSVDKEGIGAQLARANRLGVGHAVIIGQKEVMEKTIILRDMQTGAQEMVSLGKAVNDLAVRFKK